MPLQKNQVIPLAITGLSSDGNGVGHADGMAVFVPGSAVGDSLNAKVVKTAKAYAYAKIEQVVTPSPHRQAMDCPIGSVCGGCCFRHITYEAELEAKRLFVEDALRRIGKLQAQVLPTVPSPGQARYRNKVQYPVAAAADGGLVYGFYAGRSHRIVPCNDCLLQPAVLNQIAARAAVLLQQLGATAYNEETRRGLVRHIYLRQGHYSGQVMVCIVATQSRLPGAETFAEALVAEFPCIKTILVNKNPHNTNVILGEKNCLLYGSGFIEDSLCNVPVRLGPFSFSQVNTLGAERLFGLARQFAALAPGETLVDLYCGAGIIGLSMAQEAKTLIGVEIVPEAVENARYAAAKMGLANTRFLCEDAGTAAARFAQEGIRPDVITLDPPRKGCDAATLQAVAAMAPRRIGMVSCNPATLARDLAALAESRYYAAKVQPVDMFPRTKHVETCVLLSHKNPQTSPPSL
ncbi:MAG: 23S rRNA (uracil(1939)-C(5))-methyltransferase RlmD [Oscillospiraceae bacterium]